jgi:hypothetical protein
MIHLIYIYLIFNSFLLGGYCNSSEYRFDSNWNRSFYIFFLVFFGGIIASIDFYSPKIFNLFIYITSEIKFQYRMLFTDYFDKIYLVNNYTDLFWQEKKLKRIEELAQNSSKQIQRHNRQIQKKYGKGKSSLTK